MHVYFSIPDMPDEEQKRRYAMLFYIRDIAPQFEHHIQSWVRSAKDLSGVYDLYFGTLRKKRLYEEMRFINYTQALETFHRVRVRALERPKKQWQVIRDRILASVPDEKLSDDSEEDDTLRKWVERKLSDSSDGLSFRDRMREMTERYRELVTTPYDEATIKTIVKNRNVLTHDLGAKGSVGLQGIDLLLLGNRLQWLVELCLLEALGFDTERIKQLVKPSAAAET